MEFIIYIYIYIKHKLGIDELEETIEGVSYDEVIEENRKNVDDGYEEKR